MHVVIPEKDSLKEFYNANRNPYPDPMKNILVMSTRRIVINDFVKLTVCLESNCCLKYARCSSFGNPVLFLHPQNSNPHFFYQFCLLGPRILVKLSEQNNKSPPKTEEQLSYKWWQLNKLRTDEITGVNCRLSVLLCRAE